MILFGLFSIYILLTTTESASINLDDNDTKIIGGHQINILEAPHQVALYIGKQFACGGSIIDKDLILTAAHCITHPFKDMKIGAGSSVTHTNDAQFVKVKNTLKHEKYPPPEGFDYDIGLIRLEKPLELNDKVKIIPIAKSDFNINPGDSCNVTGFGTTTQDEEAESKNQNLYLATIPVIDKERCQNSYHDLVTENMICAGPYEGGAGSCFGDSGGPLTVNGLQFGIVSWGSARCAEARYPGVYVYIPKFRAWIDEKSQIV